MTYDDGPYIYTTELLDILKSKNAKATFFITAVNVGKGQIDDPATGYPAVIRRMFHEGHQVGAHTWSHKDLSKLTHYERMDELVKVEMALSNILGFLPTYMRAPYVSCTQASGCVDDVTALGYHLVRIQLLRLPRRQKKKSLRDTRPTSTSTFRIHRTTSRRESKTQRKLRKTSS